MAIHPSASDFAHLSVAERILLVESLWDDIYRDSQHQVEVSDAVKKELDDRLAREEAGEITFSPWEEVKKRLLNNQ